MTKNLIKEISSLLYAEEDELWKGLQRITKRQGVSALKLKCCNEQDAEYYVYNWGTQVVFLLLDKRQSSDLDELADEDCYDISEAPLYFTATSHRISPVFQLWQKMRCFSGNVEEMLGVILTSSFIINYDEITDIWSKIHIRVRHNLKRQPKRLPYNNRISSLIQQFMDSYQQMTLPLTSDYYNMFDDQTNTSEQETTKTIDWDDLIGDSDDPDFVETTYLPNGEIKRKNTLPPATLLPPLSNPMESLENLTGLNSIKNYIQRLTILFSYQKKIATLFPEQSSLLLKRNLHSVFIGNVGTGKTTVAQIFSSLLHEQGYLSKGHTIVCSRSSFASKYYGGEEKNVRALLKLSAGGTLVIDEAYLLLSPDERDPCNRLLSLMLDILADENNRDLCVVLCGYVKPMQQLIASNPGLTSRFPNVFFFEDFCHEDLLDIAKKRIERAGYFFTENGWNALCAHVGQIYQTRSATFGNAREIANLCEQILLQHAIRCMENKVDIPQQLLEVTADDISNILINENLLIQPDRKCIGFR